MKVSKMEFGILKEKIDCGDLKKCGEITIRISLGKKETYLNCEFCDYSYLQLNHFIQHVYEEHLCKFLELNLKQECIEGEAEGIDTSMYSESPFENDEQITLGGFEKVEIDLGTYEKAISAEEAAGSLQPIEINMGAVLSDKTNDSESDSDMNWNNKEYEKPAKRIFILEFIKVYSSLPALWNTNSKAFQDTLLKNKQYEILLQKYKERYPNATMNLVKQQIRSLHANYRREIMLGHSSKKSTLYYYDAMNFLYDITLHPSSHSNIIAVDKATHAFKEDAALQSDEMYNCDSDSEISNDEAEIDKRGNKGVAKKSEISPKKKFVLELISVYKSLPSLWDTKCEEYKNPILKNHNYETLLAKYRENYPNADIENVKLKIRSLRSNFFRTTKLKGPKLLYYYDAMTFLLNNYSQPEEMEFKLEPTLEKSKVPEVILTDSQFIILAKIYERYTCLWDEKDIGYRLPNRRREARNNLLEEFNNTSGLVLMKYDLEKEIAKLRKICSDEKKQKIACKRENVAYKPISPYYDQLAYLEVDVTPYQCEICGEIVGGSCQFKIHVSSHDGSLPFKCPVCGHGFKLTTNLTVHLRRHVQEYLFKCETCEKSFATTTDCKIHMRTHTGERPFVCDICGHKARTSSHLLLHTSQHLGKPRHKCKLCSKTFYQKSTLNEHMQVHSKVRDVICDVCNKGFKSRKHLGQHRLIHNAEKKYLCKLCGKRFAQHAGLNGHMKSHGTKLAACNYELR